MLNVVLCILTILAFLCGGAIMILLRGSSDDEEGILGKRGRITSHGRVVLSSVLLAALIVLAVVILVIAVFFY